MPFFPQFSNVFVPPYVPAPIIIPSDISGLALWIDADIGVTLSGADVTNWDDQSQNSNNLSVPSGGSSPTFESSVINGKPGVLFDGLNYGILIGADIVTAKTIYAVIKTLESPPSSDNPIAEVTGGGLYSSIGNSGFGSYLNGYYGSGTGLSASSSYIIASLSDDGISVELRQNGQIARQDSDGNGFYSRSDLFIGNGSTYSTPAKCYICELVIYDNFISLLNRQGLEAYFNNKYAIY